MKQPLSKQTTTKKAKTNSKADRFLLDNCNSHQKPIKQIKPINKGGRPTKPKIEVKFYSSIRDIETLFKFSQAKQEPIPTKDFIYWLLDTKEDKITLLERYTITLLFYSGARIGELSILPDDQFTGRRLTLKTIKKRNGKIHHRTITLPKGTIDLLVTLQDMGLIQEGTILNIDGVNTENKIRDLLRNLAKRLSLDEIIFKESKGKTKYLNPHSFRRGRATQLYETQALTKDQIASFLGHGDTRSLPHYIPEVNDSFLDVIDEIDSGNIDPISGNLKVSQLKLLVKEGLKEVLDETRIRQSITV